MEKCRFSTDKNVQETEPITWSILAPIGDKEAVISSLVQLGVDYTTRYETPSSLLLTLPKMSTLQARRLFAIIPEIKCLEPLEIGVRAAI